MNYDNTNTGAIFKNEKKADNQPDYKGKINVKGQEFEISGWIKTSKEGKSFLSLKVQEPYNKNSYDDLVQKPVTDLPF
jgi:uncharacterized protein (DUF736 family)